MNWTDERIEILRLLWLGGNPASSIGKMMGLTRSAVIGKVHRLGLKRDEPTTRMVAKRPCRAPNMREADRRASLALAMPMEEAQDPVKEPETPFEPGTDKGVPAAVVALHARQCRYLTGEGRERQFCGQRKIEGSSYCAAHHIQTHQKQDRPEPRPGHSPIDFRRSA